MTMMRQVLLRRWKADHSSCYLDVFWIDNDLAIVGKQVRDEDGLIWTVDEIYSAKPVADLDKAYKAWRRWAEVLG